MKNYVNSLVGGLFAASSIISIAEADIPLTDFELDSVNINISILQPSFREGVFEAAEKPVIFLDPSQIDPENTTLDNHDIIKAQLEAVLPGVSGSISSDSLEKIVDSVDSTVSFALRFEHDGEIVCVVKDIRESDIERILPKDSTSDLSPDWAWGVGYHEGTHCNQVPFETVKAEIGEETQDAYVLLLESGADKAVYEAFLEQDKPIMAAEFASRNMLSEMPTHATLALLNKTDPMTIEQAAEYHLVAEQRFVVMDKVVRRSEGLSRDEIELLRQDNPNEYYGIVEKALDEGLFSQEPIIEDVIAAHIGAYKVLMEGELSTEEFHLSFTSQTSTDERTRITGVFFDMSDPTRALQTIEPVSDTTLPVISDPNIFQAR